jgi:hypothetical protein
MLSVISSTCYYKLLFCKELKFSSHLFVPLTVQRLHLKALHMKFNSAPTNRISYVLATRYQLPKQRDSRANVLYIRILELSELMVVRSCNLQSHL